MNKQARSWIPSILLLIVLFVGGYWFMTRQFTINNSYSQQDFYESVQNNEVESVYIHPNKEYPTGRVSVDLTNGNSVQFYALDVKEIQDFWEIIQKLHWKSEMFREIIFSCLLYCRLF